MLFLKNKCLVKTFCESTKSLEKDFLKLDFYSILNVKKSASEKEIRISYFHLAKKFHPDKFKGPAEIFKKISDAYNTLKDPHKREEYDRIMRFKLKKKFKEHTEETIKKEGNKMQDYSKYEEEFKKLNIDKLFYKFTKSKIKSNLEDIKVFKPILEKKMSKREYQIHLFFKTLKEEQIKNNSVSYKFYKKVGMIKEELNTEKNYEELVKEQVGRIKNKQKIEDEIKKNEKLEKEKEDNENLRTKRMLYYLLIVYMIVFVFVLYKRHENNRKMLEEEKKFKEKIMEDRMKSYIYLK